MTGLGLRDIANVEGHPIAHAGVASILVRELDRRFIEIEAIDAHLGVGTRDGDPGPADAAGDIRDPRRRVSDEPLVDGRIAGTKLLTKGATQPGTRTRPGHRLCGTPQDLVATKLAMCALGMVQL